MLGVLFRLRQIFLSKVCLGFAKNQSNSLLKVHDSQKTFIRNIAIENPGKRSFLLLIVLLKHDVHSKKPPYLTAFFEVNFRSCKSVVQMQYNINYMRYETRFNNALSLF